MSMFSTGLSGLNAAQVALSTTSNNISNVHTPGYNRQVTVVGESSTGTGVQVNDIQRQFDRYIAGQLNEATSASSALNAYQTQITQIDNLLADQDAGLAPLLQKFFSALQDLSSTPSDPAARQGVLGAADTLTAQFRSFDSYLNDMQSGVSGQIKDEISQINTLAKQIAGMNKEISLAKARTGVAPNALLDQRDQLVAALSQHVNVSVTVQDGGPYNIMIGNGQSLVAGVISYSLEAMPSSIDPARTVVGYRDGAGNLLEFRDSTFKGGALGGILAFRRDTLDKTQNQLGQQAIALAGAFNEIHRQGVDLNGAAGQDFFSVGQPRSFSNSHNSSGAYLLGSVADASQVTISDYEVVFSAATGYTVTRGDTGATVGTFAAGSASLDFDGLSFQVNGAPADGDRFLLQPTRRAAAELKNAIPDPADIAAGLPGGGSGDNRNAMNLYALQHKAAVGGVATFNQAYASLVSNVGNQTNIIKINQQAQSGLETQLRGVQQSESGVNLDEEAANLVRYQQFYQANAKVIEIATSIIDTILNIRS